MIAWCTFCQSYQGETPPIDRWELTHIVCPSCLASGVYEKPAAADAVWPIAEFFGELRTAGRRGLATASDGVLARASALGVRPLDLLIGLLQPALREIGAAWEAGTLPVAHEHRFSRMVEEITAVVLVEARRATPPPESPEFLLVGADGNFHTLGPRVVELFLLAHGRSVTALVPGLPAAEVLRLVERLAPRTLGVSVSEASQLGALREVADGVRALPPARRPKLVVGGGFVLRGGALDPGLGVTACAALEDLL